MYSRPLILCRRRISAISGMASYTFAPSVFLRLADRPPPAPRNTCLLHVGDVMPTVTVEGVVRAAWSDNPE